MNLYVRYRMPSGKHTYRVAEIPDVIQNYPLLVAGTNRGEIIGCPEDSKNYWLEFFRGQLAEKFAVMFLDTRHQIIDTEILFHGTVDGASVHPREIVRRCLDHNAAAVIVSHNHPSGVSEPSRSDRNITKRLQESLSLIDVRLLDHFVVGNEDVCSFAEKGWL